MVCTTGPTAHVYDNWRTDVLGECLPRNYDVEAVMPELTATTPEATEQTTLQVDVPIREGPTAHTPHTLVRDDSIR